MILALTQYGYLAGQSSERRFHNARRGGRWQYRVVLNSPVSRKRMALLTDDYRQDLGLQGVPTKATWGRTADFGHVECPLRERCGKTLKFARCRSASAVGAGVA